MFLAFDCGLAPASDLTRSAELMPLMTLASCWHLDPVGSSCSMHDDRGPCWCCIWPAGGALASCVASRSAGSSCSTNAEGSWRCCIQPAGLKPCVAVVTQPQDAAPASAYTAGGGGCVCGPAAHLASHRCALRRRAAAAHHRRHRAAGRNRRPYQDCLHASCFEIAVEHVDCSVMPFVHSMCQPLTWALVARPACMPGCLAGDASAACMRRSGDTHACMLAVSQATYRQIAAAARKHPELAIGRDEDLRMGCAAGSSGHLYVAFLPKDTDKCSDLAAQRRWGTLHPHNTIQKLHTTTHRVSCCLTNKGQPQAPSRPSSTGLQLLDMAVQGICIMSLTSSLQPLHAGCLCQAVDASSLPCMQRCRLTILTSAAGWWRDRMPVCQEGTPVSGLEDLVKTMPTRVYVFNKMKNPSGAQAPSHAQRPRTFERMKTRHPKTPSLPALWLQAAMHVVRLILRVMCMVHRSVYGSSSAGADCMQ